MFADKTSSKNEFKNETSHLTLLKRKWSHPNDTDGKVHWSQVGKAVKAFIRITCPCNVYPITPNFYIVKLGFTGVYIFF